MAMESKDGSRGADEFQDGAGLELSLGLSLSSTDLRQKWKAAEAVSAPSASSLDPAGESSAGASINGLHSLIKHKPSNKPGGIKTAIKKFLERGLDYQEENASPLDGSNGLGLYKEKDIAASDAGHKGNPFLFKELQGSIARAGSRSQSPGHTTPLQLVDAFKSTSNSGSACSAEGGCDFGEEDTAQEEPGEHTRFQDGLNKRKLLMDEGNHQKKGKSGEASQGFCGLGINPLVSTSKVNMENSLQAVKGEDFRGQIRQGSSQEKQDSAEAEEGYETDGDNESPCDGQNISRKLGQKECKGVSDEVKGAGDNFMSLLKAPDLTQKIENKTEGESTWHAFAPKNLGSTAINVLDRENSLNRASTGSTHLKDGQTLVGLDGDKAGSPLRRMRDKVSSETSSVSTGGTEKLEEKSRCGEASSSMPEVGSDKATSSTSILASPFCSPLPASTSSAHVLYHVSPYPVVPAPYPVSVAMPHTHGMLSPTGVDFPYAMQYVPPGPEGFEQNMRPVGTTPVHNPGNDYPPQLFSPGMLPFRPSVLSPFTNASTGALYNRNTMGVMSEEANVRVPGPPISTVPHLSSELGVLEHGDIRSFKDQNTINSFPGFASSVQPLQGHALPAVGRPPSSCGNKDDAGQGGRSCIPAIQQNMQARNMEPNNLGQEEFVRALGNEFYQGSTENLLDGLGEDMAFLQNGMGPGLMFGGTGTAPKLPWVHMTGPNGRTISGVVYRSNRTQLKVVCVCHGKHMSLIEFAQHAGITDVASLDKNVE